MCVWECVLCRKACGWSCAVVVCGVWCRWLCFSLEGCSRKASQPQEHTHTHYLLRVMGAACGIKLSLTLHTLPVSSPGIFKMFFMQMRTFSLAVSYNVSLLMSEQNLISPQKFICNKFLLWGQYAGNTVVSCVINWQLEFKGVKLSCMTESCKYITCF